MSASENNSKSAKAIIIHQSFWDLFSRLIIDALDRRKMNRYSKDSKGALQVPLSLIEAACLSLFFTKKKKAPTRALAGTRSCHCNGALIKYLKVQLKVFCFFF